MGETASLGMEPGTSNRGNYSLRFSLSDASSDLNCVIFCLLPVRDGDALRLL